MELTELLHKAVPFKFDFDGFITEGMVYKYMPDKEYWAKLRADGVIVEAKAKEVHAELKTDASSVEHAAKIAQDPAQVEAVDMIYFAHLAGCIKSWDLTIKGKKVPITISAIKKVAFIHGKFLNALFDHLNEVRSGNPLNGTRSSNGLGATESAESVPQSTASDGSFTPQPNTGTVLSSS